MRWQCVTAAKWITVHSLYVFFMCVPHGDDPGPHGGHDDDEDDDEDDEEEGSEEEEEEEVGLSYLLKDGIQVIQVLSCVLTFSMTVWYGNATALEQLDRVVRTASKITRPDLPTFSSIFFTRVKHRMK